LGLREPGLSWRLGENIAVSPKETIYSSELWRVYHFLPPASASEAELRDSRHRRPFLMFYSWINAYWILDLTPQMSMLGALRDAGLDVYVTDWQRPETEAGLAADLDSYLGECIAAAEAVRRHSGQDELVMGGYCIGGVLADILVALDPDRIAALVNLTTGIDTYAGEDGAGPFGAFTSYEIAGLDEFAARHGGLLPQKEFGEFFDHVKPEKAVAEFMERYVQGVEAPDDPISYWNRRSARPAYPVHLEFLRRIYNDNELADGPPDGSPHPRYTGRPVDLKRIKVPLQVICGRFDHIVPLPVALRTCHLVGTPPEDQEVLVVNGGHVRAIVNKDLYPKIAAFVTSHAGPRDR
ncbi:MAG: alpha/beta fold hydrolase, partial [Polyangia bacterium]|nr:alpha/beta fold hydrolase [Polyangia bacterium]